MGLANREREWVDRRIGYAAFTQPEVPRPVCHRAATLRVSKLSDPDQSLRAAYMAHLSKPKEEFPREGGGLSESVLRRAYVAHIIADTVSRK